MSLGPLDLLGIRSASFSAGSSQYPANDREIVSFARSVVSELANTPAYRFTPYVLPPLPAEGLLNAVASDQEAKRILIGSVRDTVHRPNAVNPVTAGTLENICNIRIRSEQWPKILDMLRARAAEAVLDQQIEDRAIQILQKTEFAEILDQIKTGTDEEIEFASGVLRLLKSYVDTFISAQARRPYEPSMRWYMENMHFDMARYQGSSKSQRIYLMILEAHFIAKHGYSPDLILNEMGAIGNGSQDAFSNPLVYNIRDFQFGKYKIFEGHGARIFDANNLERLGAVDSNSIVRLPDIGGTCHLPISPEAFIYHKFGPGSHIVGPARRLTLHNRNAAPPDAASIFGLQSFAHDFSTAPVAGAASTPESVMLGFSSDEGEAFDPLVFNFKAMTLAYCAMSSAFTFAAGASRTTSKSTDSLLITTAEPFIGFYNGISSNMLHTQEHSFLAQPLAQEPQNSLFYGLTTKRQVVDDLEQAASTFEINKNNARRTIDMVRRNDLTRQLFDQDLDNKDSITAGDSALLTRTECKNIALMGKRQGIEGRNIQGELEIGEKFLDDTTDAMLDAFENNPVDETFEGFKKTLNDLKASLPTMTCADKPGSSIHAERIFQGVLSIIHEYVSMVALSIDSGESLQDFIAGPANLHALKTLSVKDITDLVRARIAELKTPDYLIKGEEIESAYVKMGVRDLSKLSPIFRYPSGHTGGVNPRGTPLPDGDSFPFGNNLGQQEIMSLLSSPTRTNDIGEMLNFSYEFGHMLEPSVNGSLTYFEKIARELYFSLSELDEQGRSRNIRQLLNFKNEKTIESNPQILQPNIFGGNRFSEVLAHRVSRFSTILESVFSGANTSFIDKLAKLYLSLEEEAHGLSQNADNPLGSFCTSNGRFYASGALPQNIVYTLARELKRLADSLVPDIEILCSGAPSAGAGPGHPSWNEVLHGSAGVLVVESRLVKEGGLNPQQPLDIHFEGYQYWDLFITLSGLGPEQYVLAALGTELLPRFLSAGGDLGQQDINRILAQNEASMRDQDRQGQLGEGISLFQANTSARYVSGVSSGEAYRAGLTSRASAGQIFAGTGQFDHNGNPRYAQADIDAPHRAVEVASPMNFGGVQNDDVQTRLQQFRTEFQEFGPEAWNIIKSRRMCFRFEASQMMQIDKFISSMMEHLDSGKTTAFCAPNMASVPNTRMGAVSAVFQPVDRARSPAVSPPEYAVSEANKYRTRAGRPYMWSNSILKMQKNKRPFDKVIQGIEIDLEAHEYQTAPFKALAGNLTEKPVEDDNSEIYNAINGFLPDEVAGSVVIKDAAQKFVLNVLRSQFGQGLDTISHAERRLQHLKNIVENDPSSSYGATAVFCNFIIKYINTLLESPNTLSPASNPALEPTRNFVNSNLTDISIHVLGVKNDLRNQMINSNPSSGLDSFEHRAALFAPLIKFVTAANSLLFGPLEQSIRTGEPDDTNLSGLQAVVDDSAQQHFRQLGTYMDEKSLYQALVTRRHNHLGTQINHQNYSRPSPSTISRGDLTGNNLGVLDNVRYYTVSAGGSVAALAVPRSQDMSDQLLGTELYEDVRGAGGGNAVFGGSQMQYVYLFEFVMKKMIEIIYGWELSPEFMTGPSSESVVASLSNGLRGRNLRGRSHEVLGLIRKVSRYLIPAGNAGSPGGEYLENAIRDTNDAISLLYPIRDGKVETLDWNKHILEIRKGRLTDSQVLIARAIFHSRYSYTGMVSDLVFDNKAYYTSVNFVTRPTKGNFKINPYLKEFTDELGGGLSQEEIDAELLSRAPANTARIVRMAYPSMHTNGGELILNEDGTSGPGFDTFVDEFSRALEEILKLANQIDFSDVLFYAEVEDDT